jgi:hypothetical protein
MLSAYEDELFKFNLAELKYDRNNPEKNQAIAEKYEYCIRHFFQHYQPIQKKVDIERFILIKVGSQLMQGYVDCIHKEGDDFIITDFKTSSIYKGEKALNERGQLLLYSEGLRQLGVPIENIKIRWAFLKYVTVEQQQANKKTTVRYMARNEIGESLKANAKMWLKKSKQGYSEEDIDGYLDLLVKINDLSCLPDEIQSKYIIINESDKKIALKARDEDTNNFWAGYKVVCEHAKLTKTGQEIMDAAAEYMRKQTN